MVESGGETSLAFLLLLLLFKHFFPKDKRRVIVTIGEIAEIVSCLAPLQD